MTLRRAAAAAAGHGGHGRRQVPRGRGPVQRSLVRPRLRLHRPHLPRRVLALHIQCLRHIHTVPAAVRAAFCWSAFACSGSGDWGRVASKYDNNVASFSQCLQNFHQAQGALLFPAHSFSPSLPPSLPPFPLTLPPLFFSLQPSSSLMHARTHTRAGRASATSPWPRSTSSRSAVPEAVRVMDPRSDLRKREMASCSSIVKRDAVRFVSES